MSYSSLQQDQFVTELKQYQSKTLNSSRIENNRSRSLNSIKMNNPNAQFLRKNRFFEEKQIFTKGIESIKEICDQKYGGSNFMSQQLQRNQMGKAEYVDYCTKRLRKNFQLPKIEIKKSKSEKKLITSLNPQNIKKKKNQQNNKWFINPAQRFSKARKETKYSWNHQNFALNIFKKEKMNLKNQYLDKLIEICEQKTQRKPLFCQYKLLE